MDDSIATIAERAINLLQSYSTPPPQTSSKLIAKIQQAQECATRGLVPPNISWSEVRHAFPGDAVRQEEFMRLKSALHTKLACARSDDDGHFFDLRWDSDTRRELTLGALCFFTRDTADDAVVHQAQDNLNAKVQQLLSGDSGDRPHNISQKEVQQACPRDPKRQKLILELLNELYPRPTVAQHCSDTSASSNHGNRQANTEGNGASKDTAKPSQSKPSPKKQKSNESDTPSTVQRKIPKNEMQLARSGQPQSEDAKRAAKDKITRRLQDLTEGDPLNPPPPITRQEIEEAYPDDPGTCDNLLEVTSEMYKNWTIPPQRAGTSVASIKHELNRIRRAKQIFNRYICREGQRLDAKVAELQRAAASDPGGPLSQLSLEELEQACGQEANFAQLCLDALRQPDALLSTQRLIFVCPCCGGIPFCFCCVESDDTDCPFC